MTTKKMLRWTLNITRKMVVESTSMKDNKNSPSARLIRIREWDDHLLRFLSIRIAEEPRRSIRKYWTPRYLVAMLYVPSTRRNPIIQPNRLMDSRWPRIVVRFNKKNCDFLLRRGVSNGESKILNTPVWKSGTRACNSSTIRLNKNFITYAFV